MNTVGVDIGQAGPGDLSTVAVALHATSVVVPTRGRGLATTRATGTFTDRVHAGRIERARPLSIPRAHSSSGASDASSGAGRTKSSRTRSPTPGMYSMQHGGPGRSSTQAGPGTQCPFGPVSGSRHHPEVMAEVRFSRIAGHDGRRENRPRRTPCHRTPVSTNPGMACRRQSATNLTQGIAKPLGTACASCFQDEARNRAVILCL